MTVQVLSPNYLSNHLLLVHSLWEKIHLTAVIFIVLN